MSTNNEKTCPVMTTIDDVMIVVKTMWELIEVQTANGKTMWESINNHTREYDHLSESDVESLIENTVDDRLETAFDEHTGSESHYGEMEIDEKVEEAIKEFWHNETTVAELQETLKNMAKQAAEIQNAREVYAKIVRLELYERETLELDLAVPESVQEMRRKLQLEMNNLLA